MSERTIKVTDNAFGIAAMLRPPVKEMFIGRSAEQLDLAASEVIKFYATLDNAPWETLRQHLNEIASHRRAHVMTEKLLNEAEDEKKTVKIVGRSEFEAIEGGMRTVGHKMTKRSAEVVEFRIPRTGAVERYIVDPWLG